MESAASTGDVPVVYGANVGGGLPYVISYGEMPAAEWVDVL